MTTALFLAPTLLITALVIAAVGGVGTSDFERVAYESGSGEPAGEREPIGERPTLGGEPESDRRSER